MNFAFVRCPWITVFNLPPDIGLAYAVSVAESRGATAKVFDLNIELYHKIAEKDRVFLNCTKPQLLIDAGKKVSARYGAVKMFFKIKIIKRSVVGIGKDGKIFFLRRGMPKDADILKATAMANKK